MMNGEIKNKISILKEAIVTDRLVIFAGSGISLDSGLPLWGSLLEGIKKNLNEEIRGDDALKIAQLLYNEKGEKEYYDIVKELLYKDSTEKYNNLHEMIFKLNPQHIITTNYDNFFEQIIENEGLDFSVVVKDEDLPYAKFKNLLIKYHGDFENHNIVLKENDYLEFSKLNTLKEIFVKSLFSNKIILFVGYSFSDINLKILSREIQYILKKHHQRAYLINISESISQTEKLYYENLGINIINFNQAKKEINDLDNFGDDKINLSTKSRKVFQLLNYIKQFDLYKHKNNCGSKLNRQQIIDELYNSLIRFRYFKILPSDFITNLYPINKGNKNHSAESNLMGNILTCFNEELYNLIEEYKGYDDENFSEDERDKLNFSLNRLLFSGIYHIAKPTERPDSFCFYSSDRKTTIDLFEKIRKNESCECINCCIDKFDFNNAIIKLDNYTITENSELAEDLSYAYGFVQLNNFYKAYISYKQILVKANKLKRLEVSFLAKFNMYRLGRKSHFMYGGTIDEKEIDEIKIETENIDIDSELNKVKYFVDKEVFEFLKEIKNGIYIQNLCDEIDAKYSEIPKTKSLIENGGSASNSNLNNLYKSNINLKNFIEDNFIIGNGYSMISTAYQKSINAFLVGYSMKFIKRERNLLNFGTIHLDYFDHFLITLIVSEARHEDFFKSIKDNQLKEIEICEEELNKIINNFSNFFSSSFTESNFWGHSISENNIFIGKLVSDNDFSDIIRCILNNILIVMAYFKFPKESLNMLLEKLYSFIKFIKFPERRFEYKYLRNILVEKQDEIDVEIVKKILEIYIEQKKYDANFLQILEFIRIKDDNFILNNFDITQFNFDENFSEYDIVYKVLSEENRAIFKTQLHRHLIREDNPPHKYSYFLAFQNEIFDENSDVFTVYLSFIKEYLKKRDNNDYLNGHYDYSVLNFFYLIYTKKINKKYINRISIKNNYFKFLLNLSKYPTVLFNPLWLKHNSSDVYINEFKKAPYIQTALKDYLTNNEDEELMKIYFKLIK